MNTHHAGLNSLVPSSRRPSLARRYSYLLPAALVALPVAAQQTRDSVVVRTVSTWQKDVDRLREEMQSQRKLELALFRMLADVEMQRRGALPDSQPKLIAQSQLLYNRMRLASIEQGKLRREIETLCATVRMPAGWLGVATTGIQLEDKRSDGTKIIRFLEPPTVASVEPGSPAERVGVRAGDVLMEIGGQRLPEQQVIFAELLHPGREIVLKLRRGAELVTLTPTVEPRPEVATATPCAYVEPAMAYVVAPMPAQAGGFVRVEGNPDGSSGYSYATARVRRDSTGRGFVSAGPVAGTMVSPGPMATMFSGGTSTLAGLQLVTLSPESSRNYGLKHGILVNLAPPGTPGREAGLQGGDVLISADSIELRSFATLQRVMSRSRDRVVTLVILRDKKRETVQLRW